MRVVIMYKTKVRS